MNKNVSKFLLAGDKLMPILHLRQPGFTYSDDPLLNILDRFKKLRETDDLKHTYRNELGKACLAHNAAFSDSKDLTKRTISHKILKNRAYEIAEASVNVELAQELHKTMIKKFKRRKA